jgi:hypothetical protein
VRGQVDALCTLGKAYRGGQGVAKDKKNVPNRLCSAISPVASLASLMARSRSSDLLTLSASDRGSRTLQAQAHKQVREVLVVSYSSCYKHTRGGVERDAPVAKAATAAMGSSQQCSMSAALRFLHLIPRTGDGNTEI